MRPVLFSPIVTVLSSEVRLSEVCTLPGYDEVRVQKAIPHEERK